MDRYDADGSTKHQKYFDAPAGRGYFTRKDTVATILQKASDIQQKSPQNDSKNEEKTRKRLIARTRKKLREIEVLEFKQQAGVRLHANQIAKMNRKEELEAKLEELAGESAVSGDVKKMTTKTVINDEQQNEKETTPPVVPDDSGIAPALQPTAMALSRRLADRQTKEELQRKGVLLPNNESVTDVADQNDGTMELAGKKDEKNYLQPALSTNPTKSSPGNQGDHFMNVQVGDRVRLLRRGMTGVVRYVVVNYVQLS